MLMQKIHQYEREATERGGIEIRLRQMEEEMARMTQEAQELRSVSKLKDQEIEEYQEKLEQADSQQDRLRTLERENSELKAAKLMSMFNNNPSAA